MTDETAPARPWRASRVKRLEAAAIAAVGYRLIGALGSTLDWRAEGLEHLEGVVAVRDRFVYPARSAPSFPSDPGP